MREAVTEERAGVGWLLLGSMAIVVVAVASNGNVAAVVGAVLAVPAILLVARARLEHAAAGVLGVALVVDDVRIRPYMGIWDSPLEVPGRLLYDGLEKSLGVGGLKIFGLEVLVALLGVNLLLRLAVAPRTVRVGPIAWAAGLSMGAVLWLEVWGLARGGNLRFSMLQFRPMLMTGLSVILFAAAFDRPTAARTVSAVILGAAVIRALVGLYFWWVVLPASGREAELSMGDGAYISTHADTVLWVTAMWIALGWLMERPGWRTVLLNACVQPVVITAIIGNNRRVASVTLAATALLFYWVLGPPVRARIRRAAVLLAPVLLLYGAAAWRSPAAWAKPVRSLRSVVASQDQSSDMRDIENYNLVRTARRHPLVGSGLGHEYEEEVVAISIADLLEAYRYMPHNSLLWLAGAGGLVGTLAFWLFLPIGVFLAIRLYDHGRAAGDRVAALAAVAAVCAYGTQAFADIGMQNWMTVLVTTSLLGLVAGRASATGAWPAGGGGATG